MVISLINHFKIVIAVTVNRVSYSDVSKRKKAACNAAANDALMSLVRSSPRPKVTKSLREATRDEQEKKENKVSNFYLYVQVYP